MSDDDFTLNVGETHYKGSNVDDDRTKEGTGPGSAEAKSYPALQWRDEPPSEPGWFWHRSDVTGNVVIMEVMEGGHGQDYMIVRYPNGNRYALDEDRFQSSEWAGPIPEPDEAESAG